MKLLVVPASLDLRQPFSATPAWWQLLKALHEEGAELVASPWQGPPIETLWWRAGRNPAQWQGDAWLGARRLWRRVIGTPPPVQLDEYDVPPAGLMREAWSEKLLRYVSRATIAPLWYAHLKSTLREQPDIDALLFLTLPLNQLTGVPRELSREFDVPIFFYDGDVPASLPQMAGFASGFRIYQGAQPEEFTAFICNSLAGAAELRKLGANAAYTVYYGVDETVFSPAQVTTQDIDFFFYGHGREYRSLWIDDMIARPAAALPEARFAVRGTGLGDLGPTQQLPYLSFSKLREYVGRSRINLCITRRAHASVYGSSSSRPFELASMGACIVASPYEGLELWFEPEREIIVVHSYEEALERYRWLLEHDSERQRMGEAARRRVLSEHTMRHRARQLLGIMRGHL
ncbi:MAG: glycosyltransferase [Anaerolineaceae bacterium]|nr:glycosyltransferase [Anaerolineaceae bacterium]